MESKGDDALNIYFRKKWVRTPKSPSKNLCPSRAGQLSHGKRSRAVGKFGPSKYDGRIRPISDDGPYLPVAYRQSATPTGQICLSNYDGTIQPVTYIDGQHRRAICARQIMTGLFCPSHLSTGIFFPSSTLTGQICPSNNDGPILPVQFTDGHIMPVIQPVRLTMGQVIKIIMKYLKNHS